MPSDHAEVTLDDVRVPESAILGEVGRGLALANTFVHENRIRQAASGVGAAQYCIDESVRYARERIVFGKPLWHNQAIQFPLAELQTECEMVRKLVHKTAWQLDRGHHGRERQGLDVQLPREPPRVRRGRPRDPGARRHRLHAPQAVRAHLPPPPPLPHHRGLRGDPDPARGRRHVRPQAKR